MATKINGANQIQAGTITRALHNTTTTGSALISKVIAGTNITLSSTGVDAGTGDVTINATATYARSVVSDANYSAKSTDQLIAYASLTATRTITLPAASSYPAGRLLIIDESGNASNTVYLSIVPNSTSDFINGTAGTTITAPYGYIELESNGSNNWTISDKWTLGMAQQAPSAVAITGGTINGTTIGATTPSTAVVTSMNGGQLAGFRNCIINGQFAIDQRSEGANIVCGAGLGYFIDRWVANTSAVSLSLARSTTVPNTSYTNSLLVSTSTAVSSFAAGDLYQIFQRIEGINCAYLSGKPFTISFWAYSSLAGTYPVAAVFANGSTVYSYVSTYVLAASTWTYITINIPASPAAFGNTTSGTVGLTIIYDFGAGSTSVSATANAWVSSTSATLSSASACSSTLSSFMGTTGRSFYLTGVQIEIGPVATPFEQRFFGLELQLCQRYYEKSYDIGTKPGTTTSVGCEINYIPYTVSAKYSSNFGIKYKTTKMTDATIGIYSTATGVGGNVRDATNSADVAGSSSANGTNGAVIGSSMSAASTAMNMNFHWTASAEL